MFGNKSTLEWEFLAEEEQHIPWPRKPQDREGRAKPRMDWYIRLAILFISIMAVLLVAGIGVAYACREAIQGVRALEQDVRSAVEAEQWVQHNAPQLTADVVADSNASSYVMWIVAQEQISLAATIGNIEPNPVLHIEDIRYADGIAAAEMTVSQPVAQGGTPMVYRQTRFYREAEGGWLRTQPDPVLWGEPLRLETAHLIWRYRRRDHPAVTEIAGQIDALYVRLLRDHGLSQSAEDDKQIIDVQVDYLPGLISLYDFSADSILVPSPSVYLVPVKQTNAEILVQTVAVALVKNIRARAAARHSIEQAWTLLVGVSLWQIWELDLDLFEWKDDIVQWAYGAGSPVSDDSAVNLPGHYDEICATHRLLMIKPIALGIPLLCDSTDSDPWRKKALLVSLHSASLGSLQHVSQYPPIDVDMQIGKPLLMSTVVDYAVATYGRERLPALVAALGQHDSWATLAPAVFGVSLDEFEQGWRQHLVDLP